jgi:hypothetical protein
MLLRALFCCLCCRVPAYAGCCCACLQELEEQEHAAGSSAAGPDLDIEELLDDPELERLHRYSSRGTQGHL